MNILLSIKPEYSRKIFSGEKKYEFRKRKPKSMIAVVFVYESSPTRRIVGEFRVKRIHSGSPENIWHKCKDASGIEENTYLTYCNGTRIIHALEIDMPFKFDNPINPFEAISNFKPPQDYSYVDGSNMTKVLESHSNGITKPRQFVYGRLGEQLTS